MDPRWPIIIPSNERYVQIKELMIVYAAFFLSILNVGSDCFICVTDMYILVKNDKNIGEKSLFSFLFFF